jgi:hypothetical protein
MPSWDPFGIEKLHDTVRKEIGDKVEGRAQSDISGTMVSLVLEKDGDPKFFHIGMNGMRHNDIMQEMIVDVASDEGLASSRTFRRSFVAWMIDDRRAYPKGVWPKKHAEADRLQALLDDRPDLFV